jgi:hypothetical protein
MMVNEVYVQIGSPVMAVDTAWNVYLALHDALMAAMNDIPVDVHVGWRNTIEQSATRDAEDVDIFQSHANHLNLQPLRGGYEVQDEDGYFYLGGVNGGEGPQEGECQ